jgi:hypothetical protein
MGCLRNITFIEKQAKQFPKRKNGLPGQMVSPTIVCLYAFFSLESSIGLGSEKVEKIQKLT